MFSFGKTMHNTLYAFLKLSKEGQTLSQSNLFGFPDELPTVEATDKVATKPAKAKTKLKTNRSVPSFKDLEQIFEKCWIDEWYESKKQKEDYYKLGKKIIKEFYEDFSKKPPKILEINDTPALEMPFNLKVGEHTLFGVIDRMDEVEGGVLIYDYKTGDSKDKRSPDDKEQLLIYQLAAEEIFEMKPKELVYYYLNDGKRQSFLGSEKEKAQLKEKIIAEIQDIKTSDFAPTPGWQCAFCDFKDICDSAER